MRWCATRRFTWPRDLRGHTSANAITRYAYNAAKQLTRDLAEIKGFDLHKGP